VVRADRAHGQRGGDGAVDAAAHPQDQAAPVQHLAELVAQGGGDALGFFCRVKV